MKHVAAPNNIDAQLFALSTLMQLIKRARHAATEQELGFVLVNETHALVPYRQAVLWRKSGPDGGKVVALYSLQNGPMQMDFDNGYVFRALPGWAWLFELSPEERIIGTAATCPDSSKSATDSVDGIGGMSLTQVDTTHCGGVSS